MLVFFIKPKLGVTDAILGMTVKALASIESWWQPDTEMAQIRWLLAKRFVPRWTKLGESPKSSSCYQKSRYLQGVSTWSVFFKKAFKLPKKDVSIRGCIIISKRKISVVVCATLKPIFMWSSVQITNESLNLTFYAY